MITSLQFPPKQRYIEIEVNGERAYQNITAGFIFNDKSEQILFLKKKLSDTDYICNKIVEGISTKEDYADTLAQRNEWRSQINQLESELNAE